MKKEHMIYIAVAVIVIIGVAVYLLLTLSGCPSCGKQVSSSYIQGLQGVANNYSLAGAVGTGTILTGGLPNVPKGINAPPLIVGGKPELLYVGGEFCPYCAITRWGLIIALMRFGTFSNLTYMESSPTDVYSDTLTFSFVNSSYHSTLIHFAGYEIYNRNEGNQTTNISDTDLGLYASYSQGIPFIDFANASIQSGAVISPGLLHGYNYNQILSNLTNQSSPVSQEIIANANLFTAYMCKSNMTLNTSAEACKQGYVKKFVG